MSGGLSPHLYFMAGKLRRTDLDAVTYSRSRVARITYLRCRYSYALQRQISKIPLFLAVLVAWIMSSCCTSFLTHRGPCGRAITRFASAAGLTSSPPVYRILFSSSIAFRCSFCDGRDSASGGGLTSGAISFAAGVIRQFSLAGPFTNLLLSFALLRSRARFLHPLLAGRSPASPTSRPPLGGAMAVLPDD